MGTEIKKIKYRFIFNFVININVSVQTYISFISLTIFVYSFIEFSFISKKIIKKKILSYFN